MTPATNRWFLEKPKIKKKKKTFSPVSGTVKLKLRIVDYCALFLHI